MKKLIASGLVVLAVAALAGQPLVENAKIVQALYPQDVNNVDTNTTYVSMENYGHATLVVQVGVMNASAAGITGTLYQATAVAGTSAKVLGAVSNYWQNGINGAIYTNTTTTLHGFALNSASDMKLFVVEVDASDLDVQNGFDCIQMDFDTPSAHSQILNALWILTEPRYTGDGAAQPTPLTD